MKNCKHIHIPGFLTTSQIIPAGCPWTFHVVVVICIVISFVHMSQFPVRKMGEVADLNLDLLPVLVLAAWTVLMSTRLLNPASLPSGLNYLGSRKNRFWGRP